MYEQNYDAIEVIVVDDGSQPRVSRVIRDYLDRGTFVRDFAVACMSKTAAVRGRFRPSIAGSGRPRGDSSLSWRRAMPCPRPDSHACVKTAAERDPHLVFSRVEFRSIPRRRRRRGWDWPRLMLCTASRTTSSFSRRSAMHS